MAVPAGKHATCNFQKMTSTFRTDKRFYQKTIFLRELFARPKIKRRGCSSWLFFRIPEHQFSKSLQLFAVADFLYRRTAAIIGRFGDEGIRKFAFDFSDFLRDIFIPGCLVNHPMGSYQNPMLAQQSIGFEFIDGGGRACRTRTVVRKSEPVELPLKRAILTRPPVQGNENLIECFRQLFQRNALRIKKGSLCKTPGDAFSFMNHPGDERVFG